MIELTITLQILGIVTLLLLIGVLGYVLFMLGKINKKLDSILEIITYYEKLKVVVSDFIEGPGRMYWNALQAVFAFLSPVLTKREKDG